jgi:[ribosomal protein S5]-alanine N-acetyltransferase
MKIFAETERLILREILPMDVDGLFELDSDPEVHRYSGNNPITHKGQTVDIIIYQATIY